MRWWFQQFNASSQPGTYIAIFRRKRIDPTRCFYNSYLDIYKRRLSFH